MTMTTELTPLLKQLKLGAMADTLTEPIAQALGYTAVRAGPSDPFSPRIS